MFSDLWAGVLFASGDPGCGFRFKYWLPAGWVGVWREVVEEDAVMGAVEALASDCIDLIEALGVGFERGGTVPVSKDASEDMERRLLSMSEREDLGVRLGSGRRERSAVSWLTLGGIRGVWVSSTGPGRG